jgi:D-arabinose 1-dehydrogenase-like Zn-dependent alcohol dehydrogenase
MDIDLGGLIGPPEEMEEMLKVFSEHKVKLVRKVYGLEEVNKLVEDYHGGEEVGKLVVNME